MALTFLLILIAALYGCWVGAVVLAWLLSPLFMADGMVAFTNGLVIVVPRAVRLCLTPEEVLAFEAHERGHIRHLHPFRNLLAACLFLPHSSAKAMRQELQADDYAAAHGHGPALASALRKLSTETRDLFRANRLSPA